MKRMMVLCMILLLLAGCARTEPPVSEDPPQTTGTAPEEVSAPDDGAVTEPAPMPEPQPGPEPSHDPAPSPETTDPEPVVPSPEPETLPVLEPETAGPEEVDPAEQAALTYAEITKGKPFSVWVTETDGTVTELTVEPGKNDWNVASREYALQGYVWTTATAEDWQTQLASKTRGNLLCLAAPEELSIACCEGGDVVELVRAGEPSYFYAVNPKEGQEPFEWKLYGTLEIIAQDAMSGKVWNVAADGNLPAQEAAEQMAARIAENYRNVPNWVDWKPLDAQAHEAEVFDAYHGMPEQFCFELDLRVLLDEETLYTSMWSAGAGVQEQEEDGCWHWGAQVLVEKNEEGKWALVDRGTGGYSVNPRKDANRTQAEWLVELFCLTEGWTHDWIAPHSILELSDDEIATLPAILDQLTEAEARDLCTALGRVVRESDSWRWSMDLLAPLLGDYGAWLDA